MRSLTEDPALWMIATMFGCGIGAVIISGVVIIAADHLLPIWRWHRFIRCRLWLERCLAIDPCNFPPLLMTQEVTHDRTH
jgi:hypothetical protein